MLPGFIVLRTPLYRDDSRNLFNQCSIKGSSKRNGLREDSSSTCTRNTMKSLIPPVICRNPQPLYSRSIITQLRGLLLCSHPRYQLSGFLFCPASITHVDLLLFHQALLRALTILALKSLLMSFNHHPKLQKEPSQINVRTSPFYLLAADKEERHQLYPP